MHPQAVKADLIDRGLRLRHLGTSKLTWDELAAVIAFLPTDSAVSRALNPQWMWGVGEHLAAGMVDALRWLVWAKSDDARHGRNRPKPVPRPGIAAPERIGDKPVSVADMNEFLGWEV